MKKLLLYAITLFICTIAIADTITINWGVDNQIYTTTQCEIGNDVILPNVSKRGHMFKGWQPEYFDRGNFVNFDSVPNNSNLYNIDKYNSRLPSEGDYITITDTSDYYGKYDNVVNFTWKNAVLYGSLNITNITFIDVTSGTTSTLSRSDYRDEKRTRVGNIYVKLSGAYNPTIYFYSDSAYSLPLSVLYNTNHVKSITYTGLEEQAFTIKYASQDRVYSGTWKFIYHGNWENDGKSGWTPVEQIGE